jgi:redox-sensitive bicupin YhaK (pirin superfamily)
MHPHSGIATLTWQPGSDVQYEDTTGQKGLLKAGGLEWMNAGGGAWHKATLMGHGRATGFQLWVPMPPGVEDGPSAGQYVAPQDVARMKIPGGEVLVLLGSLAVDPALSPAESPIQSHQDMNYLVLDLEPEARWRYEPPAGHDVAWAFAFDGSPLVQGEQTRRELLTFEQGAGDIEIAASDENVRVLLGTARRHERPLVLGPSSVHTSRESLARGLDRIREIGAGMRAAQLSR